MDHILLDFIWINRRNCYDFADDDLWICESEPEETTRQWKLLCPRSGRPLHVTPTARDEERDRNSWSGSQESQHVLKLNQCRRAGGKHFQTNKIRVSLLLRHWQLLCDRAAGETGDLEIKSIRCPLTATIRYSTWLSASRHRLPCSPVPSWKDSFCALPIRGQRSRQPALRSLCDYLLMC